MTSTKPGEPTAIIPLASIVAAEQVGSMVRVEFNDGSVTGLHVPRGQKPGAFIDAVNEMSTTRQ